MQHWLKRAALTVKGLQDLLVPIKKALQLEKARYFTQNLKVKSVHSSINFTQRSAACPLHLAASTPLPEWCRHTEMHAEETDYWASPLTHVSLWDWVEEDPFSFYSNLNIKVRLRLGKTLIGMSLTTNNICDLQYFDTTTGGWQMLYPRLANIDFLLTKEMSSWNGRDINVHVQVA